jgi:tetratricopeptide (TPR) repeat protein
VTLVAFSNTVAGPKEFTVSDGHWQELNKELQNTIFDGGTQMGALDLGKYPGDEFLLFSDGHSNFGSNNIKLTNRPVYTITSSAGADYSYLESIAGRSGGELINLENLSIPAGRDRLFYQTLHFMGVKAAEGLEESYPSLPTPVAGSLTVAGISYQPTASIVLQFGYGGKVVKEQTVNLRYDRQQTSQPDLAPIWAQKKIAELDTRYEDNKPEIQHLGRRYGIVTRNTSLVVLENINDYITYQIEPPAELRDEYDRILKGRERGTWASRRQVTDNAESYFNELLTWWGAVPVVRTVKVKKDTVNYNAAYARGSDGVISAEAPSAREALPGPVLMGRAPGLAVNSSAQGSNVRIGGRASKSESAPSSSAADLNDVIVVGYATRRKKDVTASVSTVNGYTDEEVSGNTSTNKRKEEPGSFTALKAEANTSYLDKLKAARPVERYTLYLQLRQDNMTTPLFYFHTASFFLAAGEKAIGLKILSNIAELEAENYELGKLLAYKLKELGETEAELAAFKQVLDWRPFEPQSYRDYGLALEDAGSYQQALDTLYYALTKNYDTNVESLYPGIEETLLPEINNLITRQRGKIDTSRIPKNLIASLPVDIRVVLNWNRPSTDIDLWVTDPDNERCYYGNRSTAMGGRISHDFTRGLGPEQFLLKKAAKGRYKVQVNYYGDTQVKLAGETSIMVEVYTNYGTLQQKRNVITLQMEKGAKGAVYVGDFDFK